MNKPGSYIIGKDGKATPNLKCPAMAERAAITEGKKGQEPAKEVERVKG